jgi:hypothetical protein
MTWCVSQMAPYSLCSALLLNRAQGVISPDNAPSHFKHPRILAFPHNYCSKPMFGCVLSTIFVLAVGLEYIIFIMIIEILPFAIHFLTQCHVNCNIVIKIFFYSWHYLKDLQCIRKVFRPLDIFGCVLSRCPVGRWTFAPSWVLWSRFSPMISLYFAPSHLSLDPD